MKNLSLVILILCWVSGVSVHAAILTTGCEICEFDSIQAAIDSAHSGDTVLVYNDFSPYCENITMRPGVSVCGDELSTRPIIDCLDKIKPTVTFDDPGIGRETELRYMEIVDGAANFGAGIFISSGASPLIYNNDISYQKSYCGAGIFVDENCSPKINGNKIHTCDAKWFGGGIYVCKTLTSFILQGNIFSNNKAGDGAGAFCGQTQGLITSNIFKNNGDENMLYGGGLVLHTVESSLTVRYNNFTSNKAVHGGGLCCMYTTNAAIYGNKFKSQCESDYGAGVYIESSNQELSRCHFTENEAGISGGAIMVTGGEGRVKISRCNIRYNSAGSKGGGVFVNHEDEFEMVNCVLAFNEARSGAAVHLENSNDPVIINNTIYGTNETGNEPLVAIFINGDIHAQLVNNFILRHVFGVVQNMPGNLSESWFNRYWGNTLDEINCDLGFGDLTGIAPAFVEEGTDFHLHEGSTGHNQGLLNHSSCPHIDFDGRFRPKGLSVDIGAYERLD